MFYGSLIGKNVVSVKNIIPMFVIEAKKPHFLSITSGLNYIYICAVTNKISDYLSVVISLRGRSIPLGRQDGCTSRFTVLYRLASKNGTLIVGCCGGHGKYGIDVLCPAEEVDVSTAGNCALSAVVSVAADKPTCILVAPRTSFKPFVTAAL
uniref:SERTA domain-containing protein n=1 Tax=Parascaris univalens TaxID=6257 RepID=A0A914ZF64_PARUN